MDRQRRNRLKYLRQNSQYLTAREVNELQRLEELALLDNRSAAKKLRQEEAEKARARRQQEENARIAAAEAQQARQRAQQARQASFASTGDALSRDESLSDKRPKRPHSIKRIVKRLAIVVAILGLVAVGVAAYVLHDAESTMKKTYVDTGVTGGIDTSKPLTLVLMGVDTGGAGRGDANSWNGNSDSQIVMTLNPKTKTTTMVSLERDTMSPILAPSGKTISIQKMNAAYPTGYNAGGISDAAQYAMATISAQAGVTVNHFFIVNMDGLVNLVNDVGGIDVVNDSGDTITIANTEPAYTATVPYIKGNPPQHINGDQALVFARDRDTLPNGDYGRAAHQREVISALFKKLLSLKTVQNYHKVLNDISGDFKTNVKMDTSSLLALSAYRSSFDKVVSVQYQGVDATAAGSDGSYASYQLMPEDVDLGVQNLLRTSIGAPTLSSLSANVISYEKYFDKDPSLYYMPSATVTLKGKKPVVYGVTKTGSLVAISTDNAGRFVGVTGAPAK